MNASSGQGYTGIGCSVIQIDGVTIRADGLAARKNNVTYISATFIWGLGAEHPRVPSLQADFRPLEVK